MAALSDAIEFIWRPECAKWRVRKRGGGEEAFDTLTLLGSLIESEVPIDVACTIFDDAVGRISGALTDGTITHDAIHSIVIKCLIDCRHSDAACWVSNYENIFGPDLDTLAVEEDFVIARHASQLRTQILAELSAMMGVDATEVEAYLGPAETTVITNRFIKIIRYCGFYKVRKAFLHAFCEELADSSVKGIFPPTSFDETRTERALDSADLFLANAKTSTGGNTKRGLNLLDLALEDIGAVGVSYFGLIPRTASRSSFAQLVGLLKTVGQIENSRKNIPALPGIAAIRQKIVTALEARSIPLKHFVGDCDELISASKRGDVRKALTLAYKVLANARIIFLPNRILSGLSRYDPTRDPASQYLSMVRELVSGANISIVSSEGASYVDIDAGFGFHELLEMGRTIRVRTSFVVPGETPPANWLDSSVADMRERADLVSLLVTNYDFSDQMVDVLQGHVRKLQRCICPVSREQMEKALRRPEEIRDLILHQFDSLIPNARDMRGRVFPEVDMGLPASLSKFERATIREGFLLIRSGRPTAGTISLGQAVEVSLRENVMLIAAIAQFGVKRRDAQPLRLPTYSQHGMGDSVSWLRRLTEMVIPAEYGQIKKMIPRAAELQRLHQITQARNQFTHSTASISEEKGMQFLSECAWALDALNRYRAVFTRAVCAGRMSDQLVFVTDGDIRTVVGNRKHAPDAHVAKGCCVYLNSEPTLFPVIHAVGVCSICGRYAELDSVGKEYTFQHCQRLFNVDRHWEELITQRLNYMDAQMNIMRDRKTTDIADPIQSGAQTREKARMGGWLRPIAEGVATAVGPIGAPLTAFLKKQDDAAAAALSAKIDEILAAQGRIETRLLEEYFVNNGLAEGIARAFGRAIADRLNLCAPAGRGSQSASPQDRPVSKNFVSITQYEEQVVLTALTNIYESDMDLFFSDLSAAEFPNIARLTRTGRPIVDLSSFVRSLKGQSPDVIERVFSFLHSKNPACDVFEGVAQNLAVFLKDYGRDRFPKPTD